MSGISVMTHDRQPEMTRTVAGDTYVYTGRSLAGEHVYASTSLGVPARRPEQPPPAESQGLDIVDIVDLVVSDLAERKRVGVERYGMALRAHNGRDALQDAYEEAMDLCVYLRQAIEERG